MTRALLEQALELPSQGQIVVTKNEAGQIVAVTRQDEDGKILKVISEAQQERKPDQWEPYLKEGETPFERFMRERADLDALMTLYRNVLAQQESKPMTFDEWNKNPYTLALMRSMSEDYVPKSEAQQERKPHTEEEVQEIMRSETGEVLENLIRRILGVPKP